MKQQRMRKSKIWMKTLLLGGCITVFSASAAFASPAQEIGSTEHMLQAPYSEEVVQMQAEIDQFLFTDHATQLEDQGIYVTHTSPNGDVVEIGIADYNEAAVNYLTEQLADHDVVIVEGEQAYTLDLPVADTLPADADTPVSTWDLPATDSDEVSLGEELERNDVLDVQAAVDQFLFTDHASELEARGIHVTHTGPRADAVEIGIVDYNEAAVNYLTEQLSDYDVVVVEGEQAYTLGDGEAEAVTTISAEVDSASEAVDAAAATDNSKVATTIVALAVAMMLAFVLFTVLRSRSSRKNNE